MPMGLPFSPSWMRTWAQRELGGRDSKVGEGCTHAAAAQTQLTGRPSNKRFHQLGLIRFERVQQTQTPTLTISMGWMKTVDSMPEAPPLTNGLAAAQMGLIGFFCSAIVASCSREQASACSSGGGGGRGRRHHGMGWPGRQGKAINAARHSSSKPWSALADRRGTRPTAVQVGRQKMTGGGRCRH